MVERLQVYIPKAAENLLRIVVDAKGEWVRYSDYARLQEQVETLRKERDDANEELGLVIMACPMRPDMRTSPASQGVRKLREAFEAAEPERERLREIALRAADQCDKWVKETYDGGWSTHQVQSQRALAESLRLAALQKEPQP